MAEDSFTLEGIPAISARLDGDGRIVGVNTAWRRFAEQNGYPDGACGLGSNYLSVCDAASGDRSAEAADVAAGIRDVLGGRRGLFTLDYPCHSPAERRWFKLLVGPVEPGAVVLHVDITPEKLAELEVDERRREAEGAVAARDRFLAAAGHDLRQPLQAADLFLDLLGRETRSAKAAVLVRHLSSALSALRDILDRLLDLSRLEGGTMPVCPERFALSGLIEQIAAEATALAEEKGVVLRYVPTSLCVETDPHLLGRILRNLMHNAVSHTDRGRILIGARRRRNAVEIQVLDTGPGIAPEHQKAIFEEFYQVANQERDRRKGLGLGLSIVKRLALLLGFEIRLASIPGRGTRMGVLIPLPGQGEPQVLRKIDGGRS